MGELSFHGVDVGLFEGGEDLVRRLLEADAEIQDDDVLVVSSKIVSLAEGRYVDLESVPVSARAERVARVTGIDEREVELILRDSRILGTIPVAEFVGERLEEYAADPENATAALEELPSLLLTERDGHICTNAGVDLSNSPQGVATLLPADPDASARRIREELEERADLEVAVVLADSEVSYRGGSVDVAIGCSGIDFVDRNFGATDLFGTPKLGGVDLIADELAAGAALLSGQADERTPIVVVRGLEYDAGEGVPGQTGLVRNGLASTAVRSLWVKLTEKISVPLLGDR